MAGMSAIFSVVSGVIGAIGAIQQANAQAKAAEYDAKVQEKNATIADQNRISSIRQADVDAEDKAREHRRTLSSIRTAYGGSGLTMEGSPLDVMEDSALEAELDVDRIAYEGRARNREGGIQSDSFVQEAQLSRMSGEAAKAAGGISAMGYLFGGFGKALSRTG